MLFNLIFWKNIFLEHLIKHLPLQVKQYWYQGEFKIQEFSARQVKLHHRVLHHNQHRQVTPVTLPHQSFMVPLAVGCNLQPWYQLELIATGCLKSRIRCKNSSNWLQPAWIGCNRGWSVVMQWSLSRYQPDRWYLFQIS